MLFSAGVGYNIVTASGGGLDSHALDYNLSTSFFQGRKISWDLYGSKNTTTYQSATNLAGYDISTTTYGANLNLRLSQGGRRQTTNNSNNNNNNDRFSNDQRAPIPLPDIALSRIHTESEALSSTYPIQEERDSSIANITYRYNSAVFLTYDGQMENFKNFVNGSSYDQINSIFKGNIRVSPSGTLDLNATVTDRETRNIANYVSNWRGETYDAALNFGGQRFSQTYYVNYSDQRSDVDSLVTERGGARLSYRIIPELSLYGGVDLTTAEMTRKATATTPEETGKIDTGGLTAGLQYNKLFTPAFLGPFGFRTSYDLSAGFSESTGQLSGQPEGRGRYYVNSATLGFTSIGWKEEAFSLDYSYSNKRDHGPLENNSLDQRYNIAFSSKRLPRTDIFLSGYYQTRETSGFPTSLYAFTSSTNQSRTLNYSATVTHRLTTELMLTAGATKGNSVSSSTYTLSTLPSIAHNQDELYYASANYLTALTRGLSFRAEAREELRRTLSNDVRSHVARTGLDYRIRSLFMNFDYQWRQDVPDNNLRATYQYYTVRLSRPF